MKYIKRWIMEQEREAKDGSVQVLYKVGSYHVAVSESDYEPGGYSFSVKPIDRKSYCPEIYVDTRMAPRMVGDLLMGGELRQEITIQTTSWGPLDSEKLHEVIKAYTEARIVAEEIQMAFPECFKKED